MEATKTEDAPHESSFAAMDPERRRFLEEALKSLTINVVEQLEIAVKTIMDETSNEDEVLNAVEIIQDYVQDIDAANDFFKVGGFCILNNCLSSPHDSVKSASLRLVRDLAQNNPFCQEKLLEHPVLDQLIASLSDSSDQVSCNGMSAISALVRAYEPALKAFLEVGGLECMLGCIGDEARIKLQIRVAFLISTITAENPHLVETFIKLNAIERLVPHICELSQVQLLEDQNSVMKLENFLSALCSLTTIDEGVQRCQSSDLNLQSKLDGIVKSVKGKEEEFQELVEFSKLISARIDGVANKEEAADR